MRAAASAAVMALLLAACSGSDEQVANNSVVANAPADIEALPPDESVATPSDELANGAAEPQGNTADLPSP